MSVFTPVSEPEMRAFLAHYDLGELLGFQGIQEGIENTNFFVTTDAGAYVLTLFERTPEEDLPYFLGLMGHLSVAGIPSAAPLLGRDGEILRRLNGRPAALVQRLTGRGVERPTVAQCAALGDMLARLHLAGADFADSRAPDRGPIWWKTTAEALAGRLSDDLAGLLTDELAWQAAQDDSALPKGVIHADLFRDNALFDGDELSGLIDFYYACNDCWLYDLAVCVNDWIINPTGTLDPQAFAALVEAYAAVRPFSAAERAAWAGKLRAAALRFWLSRLYDQHFPRPGEMTYTKNPAEFERILRAHRQSVPELPA